MSVWYNLANIAMPIKQAGINFDLQKVPGSRFVEQGK